MSARESQAAIVGESEPLRKGLEGVQDALGSQGGLRGLHIVFLLLSLAAMAVQVGRANLYQLHAQFARQEASDGYFKLRVWKEEHALSGELDAMPRKCCGGAIATWRGDPIERGGSYPECGGRGLKPACRSFDAERERGSQTLGAA